MVESANNIIVFPIMRRDTPVMTIEDANESITMARHYHIQETIANIAPILFSQLEVSGFNVEDEEESDLKDGALIIEAIRSLMCRSYDLYHPFQILSENVFSAEVENDSSILRIVDEISVDLKKGD